ncbi:MAG: peptide chain release factor N(5)-glutamine methyltransferase [Planctomycetota bacterium]|nr:peptide chain release factor N(5)-glutamine methyltransferase [Planctomycetota bacterium]
MTTPARDAPDVWTTRRLLAWMGDAFTKKGLDSPRLMAEMLLGHVLGVERLRLYTDPDRPASPLERATLRDLAARALRHEPVQYLTGEAWFFGLPFHTDRRVLIPRPSTETIVEEVLQHHRARHGAANADGAGVYIADICTGSGCIAITLLKHLAGARAIATDISADALEVAHDNARRHGVLDRIDLVQGDLLEPLERHPVARAQGAFDYLLANPPYIPDDEWPDKVGRNVRDHEPHLALRGGPDGLDLVRPIVAGAPRFLKPGGLLMVEVGDARAAQAAELVASTPLLESVRTVHDIDALPRVVIAARGTAGP